MIFLLLQGLDIMLTITLKIYKQLFWEDLFSWLITSVISLFTVKKWTWHFKSIFVY